MSESIGRISQTLGQVSGAVSALGNLGRAVDGLLGGTGFAGFGGAAALPAWAAGLQPASWRGVPFGVLQAAIRPGRATATHEYPYRDGSAARPAVWIEDTGASPRPFEFSGFLVDGDPFAGFAPIFAQRDAMVAACLQKGPGPLVHPSLGSRTVSLVGGCEMVERPDLGGAIELRFRFVETAPGPVYPSTAVSTPAGVSTAAGNLNMAVASDFGAKTLSPLQTGLAAVQQGVTTVTGWANQANMVMQSAQRAVNAVAGLAGVTGRYAGASRTVTQPVTATLGGLIAASTAARTLVSNAGAAASSLAAAL